MEGWADMNRSMAKNSSNLWGIVLYLDGQGKASMPSESSITFALRPLSFSET